MALDHETNPSVNLYDDAALLAAERSADLGVSTIAGALYPTGEIPRVPSHESQSSQIAQRQPASSRQHRIRRGYEPTRGDSELDAGAPLYHEQFIPPSADDIAELEAVRRGNGHRAAQVAAAAIVRRAQARASQNLPPTYRAALETARLLRQVSRDAPPVDTV